MTASGAPGDFLPVAISIAQLGTTVVAIAAIIVSTRNAIGVLRDKLTEISEAVKDLGDKFTKLYIDVELLKRRGDGSLDREARE